MTNKPVFYHSGKSKSSLEADCYKKTHESVYRYLAYRDIPDIIEQYLPNKGKALDYGSGSGYSGKFLQDLGFDVIGVDVCTEMLEHARKNNPTIPFYLIENGEMPNFESNYDLVFSSFVLFEMQTRKDMKNYFSKEKKIMKETGVFQDTCKVA